MKVTANIATYPPRKESLKKMLQSIEGQFDEVRVFMNGYSEKEMKEFCDSYYSKGVIVKGVVNVQGIDKADNGKFWALGMDSIIQEPEIYCTLDDDLIYPPDYRKTIEAYIENYGCIISFHGRQLLGEGLHYYRGHRSFTCLGDVQSDEKIDVPGTGVTAFSTEYFHPKGLTDSKDLRMSDLVFALEAAKQGKQIGVIHHEKGWIKHIDNKETIYETESRNGIKRQNEIADEIFKLNHGGSL